MPDYKVDSIVSPFGRPARPNGFTHLGCSRVTWVAHINLVSTRFKSASLCCKASLLTIKTTDHKLYN